MTISIKKILVVDNSPIDKIKNNLKNFKKVKYVFANKKILVFQKVIIYQKNI